VDDLRRMLGLLRGPPDAAPLAPQPGLAALDELIAAHAAAGTRVELERGERAGEAEGDVEMAVVDRSGLDGDGDRLAGNLRAPKPRHAPDHEDPQHRRNSL
jgi:hypothetical protein